MREGVLGISYDYGETFSYEKIPVVVHGNFNGRGTGSRLIVDVKDSNVLYFASQMDGLLRSKNLGKTWETLEVNGEKYMTFVWQSPKKGTLVVGTAGVSTAYVDATSGMKVRGKSLYVSYDQGEHFVELIQPNMNKALRSRFPGYVAQRYAYDGHYLYVTLSQTGENSYVVESGYSCDSGDALGGTLIRYSLDENEKIVEYCEVTPFKNTIEKSSEEERKYLGTGSVGVLYGEPSQVEY